MPLSEDRIRELEQRDLDMTALAACHWTNAEIGAHLHLSPETIKSRFAKLFRDYGVDNRLELAKVMHPTRTVSFGDK